MFFHRMKWNCLDAFNASATLRGTPLWYPLSQFPATRHYPLPSISPSVSSLLLLFFIVYFLFHVPFFPPLTFAFFSSLHLSLFLFFFFFPFPSLFSTAMRVFSTAFLSGARTLEKRKMVTREDTGGRGTWIRFNESTRGIQSPSPILPPVARTAPAEKRFRFIKNGGRATPSKNDRLWDSQQLCFPF